MQAPSDGFLPQIRLSTYSKRQIKEPLHVQDISSIACMTGYFKRFPQVHVIHSGVTKGVALVQSKSFPGVEWGMVAADEC